MTELGIPGTTPRGELTRVYVWELPVRLAHWGVAISIVGLSLTGLYMGHPLHLFADAPHDPFVMGYMKAIHFYLAILFTLAILVRIIWMFLGNRYSHWNKFLPVTKRRRSGLIPTLKFYLFALQKPPGFVGHNPLAGLVYSAVFLLYFVQIATGFAMYSAFAHTGSHMSAFSFLLPIVGGLQTARWIHHGIMWLLLGFAVHHVYSAVLMSTIEANGTMESMFSGHKFVPPEDLVYSGYRFRQRRLQHEKEMATSDTGGR